MTYNDSLVTAFALSQLLNSVAILEGINAIYDNERCSGWLNSLEYYAGNIAEELIHRHEYRVEGELMGFTRNAILNLSDETEERKAIKIAALDTIEKLERIAKTQEKDAWASTVSRLKREWKKEKQLIQEFLRGKGIANEYTGFVNQRNQSSHERE